MKYIYFTILSLICVFLNQVYGQSFEDKNQIISECISFQFLTEIVLKKAPDNFNKYYVLNHGIDFSGSKNINVKGKQVSFIEKSQTNTYTPYFLFHTINVEENKAFARYYFIFIEGNIEKIIPVTINFERNGSFWKVISYELKKKEK